MAALSASLFADANGAGFCLALSDYFAVSGAGWAALDTPHWFALQPLKP